MINLNHLPLSTRNVFKKLGNLKLDFLQNFVLVGGSALSLYLGHRKSEDLDFFTYKDFFNKEDILSLKNNFTMEILNRETDLWEILLDNVRVTFFNAKYSFLRNNKEISNLKIAILQDIAAMKVNTLFLRAKFRDYYDLFVIVREDILKIEELYAISKIFVNGLNFKLFSTALIFTEDIEDDNIAHLEPKYKVEKEEISEFFIKKLKGINKSRLS